jgi:hypothetical protein
VERENPPPKKKWAIYTDTQLEKWLVVCWAGLEKRKKKREVIL